MHSRRDLRPRRVGHLRDDPAKRGHGGAIIDDLLDVTRIIRGKMSVESGRPTCIGWSARPSRFCDDEALRKRRRSRSSSAPTPPRQRRSGSPAPGPLEPAEQRHQVHARGGEIHLRSWNAGALLTIEVEDSGIGIASEAISTIFEPFEQLDDQRANRGDGGGLGLGLAISKGLSSCTADGLPPAAGGGIMARASSCSWPPWRASRRARAKSGRAMISSGGARGGAKASPRPGGRAAAAHPLGRGPSGHRRRDDRAAGPERLRRRIGPVGAIRADHRSRPGRRHRQ